MNNSDGQPVIYLVKVESPLDKVVCRTLLTYVSEDRRERILRQRNRQAADNMLVGAVLARYALKRYCGLNTTEQQFEYTNHGKPYLSGVSGVHFNISHSGQYVACAVHNDRVGIDIQKINGYSPETAIRVCCAAELAHIRESRDSASEFIRLWTQKEAVMKQSGTGILGVDIRHCLKGRAVASRRIGKYWLSVCI